MARFARKQPAPSRPGGGGHRYSRLRRRLLLAAALGLAAACLLGVAAAALLGQLNGPAAQVYVWTAGLLFGLDEAEATERFRQAVSAYRGLFAGAAALCLTFLMCGLMIRLFTRWLDRIGSCVRQVAGETGEPVALPRVLAPLQADLAGLQDTLRQRQLQAGQAEQRKNDLLVFLAHDLKTPLTSAIGYLTLLRDDPDLTPEQRAKYTGIALDKSQRLEDLMLEFFEIARDGPCRLPAKPEQVHLSMLLEQLADEFMPQFQEKGLACQTAIEPRLAVSGEADKLARVFDNVLRNAVSYSAQGGTVEIEAGRRGDRVVVVIRNQGLEIPEQELTRIFQKFYRLDAARSTRTGGAGLGLAIAREIVEAHGGSIHAESNGRKTSFVIDLPSAG